MTNLPCIIILLCLGAWADAENSIRLLPVPKVLSTGSSRSADARVRRYRASMHLDEAMFDMTDIILGLEDEMVFTKSKSYKRANGIKGETIVWSGLANSTSADDATVSFLTLSQSPSGGISASLKTARTSYSIMTLSNGNMLVTATDYSKFQYEPAAAVDSDIKNQAELPDDGFPAIQIAKSYNLRSRYDDDTQVSVGPASRLLVSTAPETDRQRNLQTIAIADVLVLVTNEAMCLFVDLEPGCPLTDANAAPIIDYLQTVAETEVNEGMQNVGARSGIRIVQVSILSANLNQLKPDVASLVIVDGSCLVRDIRVEESADLVAVITGDNVRENGRITLGIAEISGFASVIGLFGLLNTFTFSHEIGHSYGCLHDRETCEQSDSRLHPYAHGFQLIPFHYTVMAYQCVNNACPQRLPFFSNPVFMIQNRSLGDEDHNNVRQLNAAALAVSRRSLTATCNTAPTRAPTGNSPTACDPANPFCSVADIILQLINLIVSIFGQ